MTSGYSNMPELNKEAFKEGYFYTGDLGKKDEKGLIYITGRKKIFIDTGGNKVDPIELEDILINHPRVKEVVIVGIAGPHGGEMIKAVIVPDGECTERDILSFCRGKIASFKIPQVIEFRDEIPKSPLGKILRKNLL
jgi:long-chain acyl-CoA synthetase